MAFALPYVRGDGGEGEDGVERLTRYPPAVEQEDASNLVKFYALDRSLAVSILRATISEKLEYPFVPDETEHLIIALTERRSVLPIGRSTLTSTRGRPFYALTSPPLAPLAEEVVAEMCAPSGVLGKRDRNAFAADFPSVTGNLGPHSS